MRKILITLCFVTFWQGACRHEEDVITDANGVATKLPHLWGTSISNSGELSWDVTNSLIVFNNKNVIVGGNKDNKRQLISIDSETGKTTWIWSDLLGLLSNPTYPDPIAVEENKYHLYQNKWVFLLGSSTYCIDIDAGTTFWKHKIKLDRFGNCGGIGNLYFNSGKAYEDNSGEELYVGKIVGDPIEKPLIKPTYDYVGEDKSSLSKGYINRAVPFVDKGDTLVAVLFVDPAKANRQYQTAMGLYNYTRRRWVYERAVLNSPDQFSNVNWAKLHNGRIYHTSGRSMHCNDVMTGKEIWRASFSQGFVSSGFVIVDGKIFANNGDRFTYCLNPETGRQIWKEESSGSASPISYLNGVLYFMGGGDGRLHAIDANTGKHLWRLRSPDVDKNSGAFFYGTCVAVPGQGGKKGRVVATTGLNAYGYEAIR